MVKVLVCGGRDYGKKEHERLWALSELVHLHCRYKFSSLIEGGASGGDALGREFRRITGLPGQTYPARRLTHGRAAGPIRNQQMIDDGKPDLVVAFPGGAGTADMVRRAHAAGLTVCKVSPNVQ